MQTPNRLDALGANESSAGTTGDGDGQDRAVLEELRRDLGVIVAELTKVVEERAAQAKALADEGLEVARDTIRTHPMAAITVAALMGAAVAIAFTSAPRAPRVTSRLANWSPPTSRADLLHMADGMHRSVAQSSTLSSLATAFERVVEQISTIDPKASLSPALEKAGSWLNSLRTAMGGK
jgi:hypothetical protein